MVQRRYVITPPGFGPHVMGTTITELSREAHLLVPASVPPCFSDAFRRVLLGNWAAGVPIPGNKGMKVRLSEVAELARLKPLQYLLEGPRVDAGSAGEGMLHGNDCE